MTNLNPIYTLQESKEFRKQVYGDNFEKHEKLIKDSWKKRKRVNAASKPAKDWAKGETRLERSPLGKAAALSERKSAAKGKISDKAIKAAKKLRKNNPKKLVNNKATIEWLKKTGQNVIKRIR